jgi:hypothetical protein
VNSGRTLILVPLKASMINASDLSEHITEAKLQGVGPTPWEGPFASDAISEPGLLLYHEDTETRPRQDARQ